jgi:hypothetical protein
VVIGLIPAFNEARNIGPATRSLFVAGCERVVILDGAYRYEDGSSFMDGGCKSSDGMSREAKREGAEVIVPRRQPRFGEKREMLLRLCGASEDDHVLFMDADERAMGSLRDLPEGHANVVLRNRKPNDLPDIRGIWPRGDAGEAVPLLRLLRWAPGLHFLGLGKFALDGEPIEAYDDEALNRDPHIPLEQASALPLLRGFEIHHVTPASPERIKAKRRMYA